MDLHTFVILVYIFLNVKNHAAMKFNCFDNPDDFKCNFGVLTPYRYIANYNDAEIKFTGCEVNKIWLYLRHGTRYPSDETVHEIVNKLPEIRDRIVHNAHSGHNHLTAKQILQFVVWQPAVWDENIMKLSNAGELEMYELAQRFQLRFPTLLMKEYDSNLFQIRHTGYPRTEESAKNFFYGLFGREKSQEVFYPDSDYDTPINPPYNNFDLSCTEWYDNIYQHHNTYEEVTKFRNSSTIADMLQDISDRIGFAVDYETVALIRDACIYETINDMDTLQSPWCELLSKEHYEIFLFISDLYWYWLHGYGYELSYKISCPILKDMFDFFESSKGRMKTFVYFAHLEEILKIISLLGIAEDQNKLYSDSYCTSKNRQWKTSYIGSFGANIAFIYYKCEITGPSVLTMFQERIVNLPGCPNNFPCPIGILKDNYPSSDEECDLEEMCYAGGRLYETYNTGIMYISNDILLITILTFQITLFFYSLITVSV